jgi:hypothetical protein
MKKEELADMAVTVAQTGNLKIKWVHRGEHKNRLIEEDFAGVGRVSITFRDIDQALTAWYLGRVRWL